MNKKFIVLLLLLIPLNVFAYSDKLVIEGKPIGIEAHSNGVYVINTYKNTNLKKGDLIKEVNNNSIRNINDLNKIIVNEDTYNLKIIRNNKEKEIKLKVSKENDNIDLGVYLKDQINGIGTLSYIDPETRVYASLGHEILESSNLKSFNLRSGYIYDININNINKNNEDRIGEYHGTFKENVIGTIDKNEINGIYGIYTEEIEKTNLVEVSNVVTKDDAYLRMNINNEINDYLIKIVNIDEEDNVKNIYFEIIDEELLELTGGIIQGMSGTPIIQNNKIIGVVNYVVVDDSKKGYGIFIKKMLEEGDKILN